MPHAILHASASTIQPPFTAGWARPSCSPPGERGRLRRSPAFGFRAQLKPRRDLSYMWNIHGDPDCRGHQRLSCSLDRGRCPGAAQHPSCSASPHGTDQSHQPGCHRTSSPRWAPSHSSASPRRSSWQPPAQSIRTASCRAPRREWKRQLLHTQHCSRLLSHPLRQLQSPPVACTAWAVVF